MSIRISHTLKAISLAISLALGGLAHAADPLTEAMQAANAPYRMAL